VLLLFVSGCQTPGSALLGPHLLGIRLPNEDARAELVLRQYLQLADSRTAMRGRARVALEGPDFKLNRPQRVLVERPARLRFEIIGLFDQIAAMLAVDGDRFGFYDAAAGRVTRGRVTPSLLWDLAKIDLEVPELVELLLGAPRPSLGLARASAWLEPSGRIALVFAWPEEATSRACRGAGDGRFFDAKCFASDQTLEEGGELFYFDPAGRLVEVRNLAERGRLRFRATFEDYESLSGTASDLEFPKRTTIRSPGAGTESVARFNWKRVMLEDQLSDRMFQIRLGAKSSAGG
jgi:hypothetical protein